MHESQAVEVIEHAARMTRMAEKPKQTLVLQARGYSYQAIAAELCVEQVTARGYAMRGWRKIKNRTWQDWELQQLQTVVNKIQTGGDESLEEHAAGLLAASKNSRRVTPVTPTYDANGRTVGGRDGLISVDDIIRLLLGWNGMRRLF